MNLLMVRNGRPRFTNRDNVKNKMLKMSKNEIDCIAYIFDNIDSEILGDNEWNRSNVDDIRDRFVNLSIKMEKKE